MSVTIGTSTTNITTYSNGKFQLYYQMWYTQQDIANNRTYIHRQFVFRVLSGGSMGSVRTTISATGMPSATRGSETFTEGIYILTSSEGWVNHNSDGTWSQSVTGTVNFGDTYIWSVYQETAVLPTIPRASSIKVNATSYNVNGTNQLTYTITAASSAFKHGLIFSMNGQSTSEISVAAGTTTGTYTIPLSLFAKTTTKKADTCTLTCKTYNGSTHIGSSTTSFTLNAVAANFKPTIPAASSWSILEPSTGSVTGITASTANTLKSLSSKTIKVTFTTVQNATVSSAKITCGSKTVTMTQVSGKQYQGVIEHAESAKYTISMTDSRGFSATAVSVEGTLYSYVPPTITSITLTRASNTAASNLTLTVNGTYYYNATTKTTSTPLVTKDLLKYAKSTSNYPSVSTAQSGNPITTTKNSWTLTVTEATGFAVNASRVVYIRIVDPFGQTDTAVVSIGPVMPVLWMGKETIRTPNLIVHNKFGIKDTDSETTINGSTFESLMYKSGTNIRTVGGGTTNQTFAAGVIGSGTFAAARIPNLDAAKINSGTFGVDRIPTLTAAKISGTFTRASGSFKFPDGTMIQWGSLSVPHNSTQTKSFPTAFGTSCLSMWATSNQVGFGAVSTIAVKADSKSQFKISQYNTAGASMTVEWFAIGY